MKVTEFDIPFSGLALGKHEFAFELNDKFFELFEYQDQSGLQGKVQMELHKSETLMDTSWSFTGSIAATCDVTGESFTQDLNSSFELQIKLGNEYNDENDEILILPYGDHKFNAAQLMYELVVLSIPLKLVSPNAETEEVEEEEEGENNEQTDPRWDQLKDLLNK